MAIAVDMLFAIEWVAVVKLWSGSIIVQKSGRGRRPEIVRLRYIKLRRGKVRVGRGPR